MGKRKKSSVFASQKKIQPALQASLDSLHQASKQARDSQLSQSNEEPPAAEQSLWLFL